jgi:hypothetical protein
VTTNKELNIILTKDSEENPNGTVIPIWHVDDGYPIDQVYLTTVAPGCHKGPHLHMKREGRFTCIQGNAVIITLSDGLYTSHFFEEYKPWILTVPAGTTAAIYNIGEQEAFFLNMPCPPWRADDPDECPVQDWDVEGIGRVVENMRLRFKSQ